MKKYCRTVEEFNIAEFEAMIGPLSDKEREEWLEGVIYYVKKCGADDLITMARYFCSVDDLDETWWHVVGSDNYSKHEALAGRFSAALLKLNFIRPDLKEDEYLTKLCNLLVGEKIFLGETYNDYYDSYINYLCDENIYEVYEKHNKASLAKSILKIVFNKQ